MYSSCVVSKLLFSLECECTLQADKKRLDAFHCRCLRRIFKIPVSWISRVPNSIVYQMANSKPLSETLLFQQLVLFGKIAKLPDTDYIRRLTFQPSSITPTRCMYRRRGRPRLAWQAVLHARAVDILNQQNADYSLLQHGTSIQIWKQFLTRNL